MRIRNWRVLRPLERALLISGVVCVTWAGFTFVRAERYQRTHRPPFPPVEDAPAPSAASAPEPEVDRRAFDGIVGLLEIPRLEFSVVVAEGDDDSTLSAAVGHLPDTPLPWVVGNSVFAGHRDTHFRALREIAIGDLLRLRTSRGQFDYEVRDKMIVNPDDVWVLAPSSGRRLTLVTCYPFSYVGRAPQRFIVTADAKTGDGAAPERLALYR